MGGGTTARVGSFSPPQFVPGAPLNIVHPVDNKVFAFDPEIEAMEGLSDEDRVKLQDQIDQLTATLTLARDFD